MFVCSWTSCPNLKYAYTSWKTPLFLCTEKLMTCREDKLVSFISCGNLTSLTPKLEHVRKNCKFNLRTNKNVSMYACTYVCMKFGRLVTQTFTHKLQSDTVSIALPSCQLKTFSTTRLVWMKIQARSSLGIGDPCLKFPPY